MKVAAATVAAACPERERDVLEDLTQTSHLKVSCFHLGEQSLIVFIVQPCVTYKLNLF